MSASAWITRPIQPVREYISDQDSMNWSAGGSAGLNALYLNP